MQTAIVDVVISQFSSNTTTENLIEVEEVFGVGDFVFSLVSFCGDSLYSPEQGNLKGIDKKTSREENKMVPNCSIFFYNPFQKKSEYCQHCLRKSFFKVKSKDKC